MLPGEVIERFPAGAHHELAQLGESVASRHAPIAPAAQHVNPAPQAEWAPSRGPRRRDLTKPQKGSPSTCGAGAMHILALQPNLMSRSAGYATEHYRQIVRRDPPRGRPDRAPGNAGLWVRSKVDTGGPTPAGTPARPRGHLARPPGWRQSVGRRRSDQGQAGCAGHRPLRSAPRPPLPLTRIQGAATSRRVGVMDVLVLVAGCAHDSRWRRADRSPCRPGDTNRCSPIWWTTR